ncbi:DNA repair protein [Alicycliphilus denitrificans]|jgi:exonuclease SbcC|uniref:DNA repair protein n=1 Tax=Alicycliphilus denitrificans TaxID=179636 RepID=UPI00384EDA95
MEITAMQLLSLTLKGFRGIRDGLGLNVLTLDFEALCDGAELVAIAGANGRGKTTVLDNMHPYLAMPSRASAAGAGGFSYYDHVFLPENEKDLVWALEGRSYRSQVVIRLNGRRRTEAFLFVLSDAGAWRPLTLEDGTVSDGKVETYTRCVEHLCGSADTFFTSVFGAQGKRQLSDYRNAEIKTLLADLLGQEQIRELGRKAGETAKLLKAGLVALRQEAAAMDSETGRLARAQSDAADAPARADQAQAAATAAALTLGEARQVYAQVTVQREQAREADARRAQLLQEREAVQAAGRTGMQELEDREKDELQRLDRLTRRAAQRQAQVGQRRERLEDAQARCRALLAREHLVRNALRRLPQAERLLALRAERARQGRDQVAEWEQAKGQLRALVQRVQGIEREAGQAALQAQSLRRRLGLAAEVPCAGMPLQGACQLLADTREAQALIPSADAVLRRLADEKVEVERDGWAVKARVQALAKAGGQLEAVERRLERARNRASRLALLAAKADDMRVVRQRLAEVLAELSGLGDPGGEEASVEAGAEREERDAITAGMQAIDAQRTQQSERLRQALARLDAVLQTLPEPFEPQQLVTAATACDHAVAAHENAQRAHIDALKQLESLQALRQQQKVLAQCQATARRRVQRVESAMGDWALLARCMSNDGLIALAIDDAGPALSGLANELLLACYGPRFTVSILTQAETAKGEKREDFDILVHDAESGEGKSVRLMSGGERVWINECLVRAVALYLAQTSERRYETLFSDEADGALDPDRKRMFGAMKREVLRLGGYRREFFVSQTPELAGMADAVIDLEALRTDADPVPMERWR